MRLMLEGGALQGVSQLLHEVEGLHVRLGVAAGG